MPKSFDSRVMIPFGPGSRRGGALLGCINREQQLEAECHAAAVRLLKAAIGSAVDNLHPSLKGLEGFAQLLQKPELVPLDVEVCWCWFQGFRARNCAPHSWKGFRRNLWEQIEA